MMGHSNWDSYEVVRIGLSGPGAVVLVDLEWFGGGV